MWLDYGAAAPEQRFKMFQFCRYDTASETIGEGCLHTSRDGIHWSDPVVTTQVAHDTSFFYNPFRKKWFLSVRGSSVRQGPLRTRRYHERDQFLERAR